MYVTEEHAECCTRHYSRTVGRTGWTHCFDCKKPLTYRPSGNGTRISPEELRRRQQSASRYRREEKERQKAAARQARDERRAARKAQEIRDRYPLFAEFLSADSR